MVLVAVRVFSVKRSTARAFGIPLRILSRKKMTGDNGVFFSNLYFLGVKNISSHAHKIGYLVPIRGSFEKIRRVSPFFYMRSPPGPFYHSE